MSGVDRQLAELETRVAFQDQAIESLNRALADQQQQLLRQQRLIDAMAQRLRELASQADAGVGDAPQDERPPHY